MSYQFTSLYHFTSLYNFMSFLCNFLCNLVQFVSTQFKLFAVNSFYQAWCNRHQTKKKSRVAGGIKKHFLSGKITFYSHLCADKLTTYLFSWIISNGKHYVRKKLYAAGTQIRKWARWLYVVTCRNTTEAKQLGRKLRHCVTGGDREREREGAMSQRKWRREVHPVGEGRKRVWWREKAMEKRGRTEGGREKERNNSVTDMFFLSMQMRDNNTANWNKCFIHRDKDILIKTFCIKNRFALLSDPYIVLK